MASLAELARVHTELDGPRLAHLQRLVASWGLLADLSFADLLLFASTTADGGGEHGAKFVVLGQIRPTTSQTIYRDDFVGTVLDDVERPLVARTYRLGEIIEGEVNLSAAQERVRVLGIPVRWDGDVIAVMSRESAPTMARHPGELEATYHEVFMRFARMIAAGDFPFAAEDSESEEAPRVGDGVIVLDDDARVIYASPNGVSALHRLGVHANTEGMRLAEVGFEEAAVRTAFAIGVPVTEEIERGPEITVLLRCLPLIDHGNVDGALVLLRDISELRRRDRLLISMDATIREIHHRVKNNLQTISSLLRLQGRRLEAPEAKGAIEESVRRIRSIALVHETLSREAGDDVPFTEIVRPLVRMVEEGLVSSDRPVRFRPRGDAGMLPARMATPLAVVLTELLQNAVQHAYPRAADGAAADGAAAGGPGGAAADGAAGAIDAPGVAGGEGVTAGGEGGGEGLVEIALVNDGHRLHITVSDDGVGLPEGFNLEASTGLGLSIVRTLVTSELAGTIALGPRDDGRRGTTVTLVVPVQVTQHTGP
jgi:two-component sensor histidine kinase